MALQTVSPTLIASDVVREMQPLPQEAYPKAVAEFLGDFEKPLRSVESCSCYHGELVMALPIHPLVSAVHLAFARHYPLVLSPDMIWLTIAKGLAIHVNLHADRLRSCFVGHRDKQRITVRRDDFVKGSPENPWPEVFVDFSQQVRNYMLSDVHELIVCDFTTSGPVERAASEIALLDTVQAYFEYDLLTVCGIPEIRLEGTAADWQKILQRVSALRRFGLGWWADRLSPVLEQFAAAVQGKVEQLFWERIYNCRGSQGSGDPMPAVSGWVKLFFPYLIDHRGDYVRNAAVTSAWVDWLKGTGLSACDNEPRIWMFPRHPATAPFNWLYHATKYDMDFIGGLIGVSQDADTLALRPEVGWAVRDRITSARESLSDDTGFSRLLRLQRAERRSD